MSEENLCVLIDFENIAAGVERENLGKFNIKLVMNRLKEKGRVLLAKAYGDWGRFAKYKQSMLEQSVNMSELTSYRGQDKNRADIALVVDAMELIFTRPHIQTFVLLSGDSDFTPLVMKLRELNKKIIGIGTRKSTSRLLSEACDEFIFYENLLKRASKRSEEDSSDESSTAKTLTKSEAMSLLVETMEGREKDSASPIQSGNLKQFMLRKSPTFDEGDYGFSGFTEFLEYGQKKGLVYLITNEKGGGYNVTTHLPAPKAVEVEPPEVISEDEFQTDEAKHWADVLSSRGFNPITHYIRHTVVHEFVDHILDRRARKKRSTLIYTYGDIARRCRKTDPVVPVKQVKQILHALQAAGELIGPDNKPIRSRKIPFTIHKDAEDLLQELRIFYLKQLIAAGEELSRIDAVSELLWGDLQHHTEAFQILEAIPETKVQQDTEFVEGKEGDLLPQEDEETKANDLDLNDVLGDVNPSKSE